MRRVGASGALNAKRIFLAAAVLASFLAYLQCLGYSFVYDDIPLIAENPDLRNPANIPSMFGKEDVVDGVRAGYYRPLVPVIDLALFQAAGPSPFWFHLANLIYHLVTVSLLYLIALRLLGKPEAALVASLFFGLHPANTEAVAFVTGKNNLICGAFVFSALLAFFNYRDGGGRRWLAISVALYLPALFTKEFALMLPFALAAFKYGGGWRGRRDAASYVPFLFAIALYLVVRGLVVQGVVGPSVKTEGLLQRLLFVPELMAEYLRLVFFPFGQKALYDIALVPGPKTVASASFLALAGFVAIRRRGVSWVRFSTLWFFLFLLPVMNIIPVSGSAMAERYLYVPMAGAGIFFGGLYLSVQNRNAARGLFALCLVSFAALTVLRNPVWKDDMSLYSDMVRTTPTSYKGYYNLGNLMYKKGMLREAASLWGRALEAKPDMFAVHNNLGVLYEDIGELALAEEHYRAVLAVRTMPEVSMNLGNVLRKQKRFDEAEEVFGRLIALSGGNVQAYMKLSELYEDQGRKDRAIEVLRASIVNSPDDYRPHERMGVILGEDGRYDEAEGYLSRALELEPSCRECAFNLDLVRRLKAEKKRRGRQP